jgi:hypothetical protein
MDANPPDDARWEPTGPDADDPPWAGHDRDEEGGDEDDARADEESQDTAPPHVAGHAAGGPGAELDEIRGMPRPPTPPRRTGVFLDPEDLREHVGGLLRVMLGGYQVDAWGNYTFVHDGARVYVTVGPSPIGPQVGVFSVTNVDIDLTPPLAAFMVTTNHRLGFGSLSYDQENRAVWLRHTLLGTTLDGPELQTAVAAVASTAAHLDDRIAEQFGGRTFHDAPEDVQRATRPPETPQQPYPDEDDTNVTGYL